MQSKSRIYFLDALRAFAILMMLQGHFISGLLDVSTIDTQNIVYRFWLYCRGFTAPVFFTITGWVFTFLLLKEEEYQNKNPRIQKGIRRGVELLLWGHLLRLNLPTLFSGSINTSFFQPDVLHIIGLSLFVLILIYLLFYKIKKLLGGVLLVFCLGIFITEPLYSNWNLDFLPGWASAYLIKGYGGVFYLFPWLGYTLLGGALAVFFQNQYLEFKKWILPFALTGFGLVLASSWLFKITADLFNISLFQKIAWNNYLFIRLGDVFILLSLFMALESYLKSRYWKFIGRHTLELYILHYLVLYGSLTGYGLYKFYANELTLLTTLGCTLISLILIILGSFAIKKIRNRNKHFN